ncbi:MAG: RHS repeat-associated core domain-containing protein [Fibrobacter sp.]|nr:RHS repeat-associated core domain-containing protein [Fibrobacter sp.]
MAYDGTGRRVSKTRERKACISETSSGATFERTYAADWERELVTHYTGIGTEVRENYRDGSLQDARVVVNMPQGLGRYGVEDAEKPSSGNATFEWYLKNHLGSTMLVYGTGDGAGSVMAAYDYRAFGEQVTLSEPTDKVTENFTGKERDDETELNYFGARYLDPMLGLWISVDAYREFWNSYAYGPGSPVNGYDGDGNVWKTVGKPYYTNVFWNWLFNFIDGMGQSSNTMGRKVYYSANSNPTDIRVRHITQQWVYDPNASDEVNGRHPFGTRRTIKQTKADERLAKMQYQNLYGNGSTLGWSDNMNWTPQIFDNSYKDFPSIELDYSNLYEPNGNASFGSPIIEYEPEPNGNVEIGELICATCSD